MKKISFFIWLIMIFLWNFLYPNAIPIFDVIAAVVLSFIRIPIEKILKKNNLININIFKF
tara:strand:+ start:1795 stop:1974 length:180 start_codon:yes stop_codon:yes gene_type:complete